MKAENNKTQWLKIGKIANFTLIGKDVMLFGIGCHVFFYNLITNEENVLNVFGNGVKCLAGHRFANVFAYAEDVIYGYIWIKSYPTFELISRVVENTPARGFRNLVFADTSFLLALGDVPNCVVYMYNWRTGEKLAESKTDMFVQEQLLRCNWGKPIHMAQLVKGTKNLVYWDIFQCCKTTILRQRTLELKNFMPKYYDVFYSTDNAFFVVDSTGNVYTAADEYHLEKIIKEEIQGNHVTCMDWFKAGLVVSGPNDQIRHYKKVGYWTCDWTIDLSIGLKMLRAVRNDFILGVTVEETVIKIPSAGDIVQLYPPNRQYSPIIDFCLIYPAGEYIAVRLQNDSLMVFNVRTGHYVSQYNPSKPVKSMSENPEFPYMAVGYEDGSLELISLYNPMEITLLVSFNLHSIPLNSMQFFEKGRILVVGNLETGGLFVIEGLPGSQMRVVAYVDIGKQIIDYMLIASKNCYRLFTLPVTCKILASNKILRHCIMGKDHINIKEYKLENEGFLYNKLVPTDKIDRDKVFYALGIYSRRIHILETRRGDDIVRKIDEIKTGHQVRKPSMRIDSHHAITWSGCGFVFARSKDLKTPVAMVLAHHRNTLGVEKAYIDPSGKYVISMGRERSLICTDIVDNSINEELMGQIREFLDSPKVELMFKRKTLGYDPGPGFEGKTWIEVQQLSKEQREAAICKKEKEAILAEFTTIRTTLRNLVSKNLEGPENEKIDLLEFYLDTATYNQKKNQNKEECKTTEAYLKALITAQDKVSNYLKATHLEPMLVPGKVIRGMFQNTIVSNYTMYVPQAAEQSFFDEIEVIREFRRIQQSARGAGKFRPWLIVEDKKEFLEKFNAPVKLAKQEHALTNKALQDYAILKQLSLESQIATEGCITQSLIERDRAHCTQADIASFYQFTLETPLVHYECCKLRELFNKSFDAMMEEKYREMDNVRKKHDRLRTIVSEYNYFSENKTYFELEDPTWTQDEQTWLITQVAEDEIVVRPYVSPSEQAILDAKAAEEERIRLALLADDFRERALMAMMNGVLEIRWEDELKKDVPLPKCMIEKDPAQFNKDDVRAVKEYEEKVVFLNSERERYKTMLDAEFTKLSTGLRDSIRKFNVRLKECTEHKMQIESAIKQETLTPSRARVHQHRRILLYETEGKVKAIYAKDQRTVEELTTIIQKLTEAQKDCRASLENLKTKEKPLEKAFRREIQDYNPIIQEQSTRLYRRRPKISFRNFNSSTVLFELAKCLLSQGRSDLLSTEALEFIRSVEHMDCFTGVPATIDENVFNMICRHRRLRIEFEIKMKALQILINTGDVSISDVQKYVNTLKENIARHSESIENIHTDYLYLMHNKQVQFVLRKGLVEIPLTGDISDFNDAIFIQKKYILDVNKLIKSAGEKKLQTIKHNMAFRRNIMMTEWEHQKLRMHINDLIEEIRDINDIKFTREMQIYLKNKALGRNTDQDSYEQEIELLTNTYANLIKEKTDKYKTVVKHLERYKRHNEYVDRKIVNINMDVCNLRLQEDVELEKREQEANKIRMGALLRRSNQLKQIQKNHQEILMLQTELELLRLRTYPTFKYKVIGDETK